MKSERLTDLTISINSLEIEISIFKLQYKYDLGFQKKEKLDKLNKTIDRGKIGIRKYEDICYKNGEQQTAKEIQYLLKALDNTYNTFTTEIPENLKDSRYNDIVEQSLELIEEVSSYNTLVEPERDLF